MDFATGNASCTLGGGCWFYKQRNYQKNLVSKEENCKYITLSQTSCLNLDKFGIGNCISDCRSAPFAGQDLIFCVIYVSERTHFYF